MARVAGALYEGRQREEGPELRSCGVLLLSLWGTSPNTASLSEVRHVGLTGTWGLFDKAAACGLDHGFSQPCATFTLKRAHVMSCLIHDSRLTSAIDLGHTLPPCLSPYLATAALLDQASSLVVAPPCDVHACIYASMHHALMVNLG